EAPLLEASRTDELARWLAGTQDRDVARPLDRVRLVVFAGDHGVHVHGVSRHEADWTVRQVRQLLDGTHPVAALAAVAGVEVAVHAVGLSAEDAATVPASVTALAVHGRSGDISIEDALSAEETETAVRAGAAIADAEIDAGVDLLLLGDLGAGATTSAAVLVAACLRKGAVDVVGRGSGIDDDAWMRKTAVIRDAVRRSRKLATRPTALLQAVSSADVAAAVGFLLRAAARRTPVLLDGVVGAAAALVASRGVPGVEKWWQIGAGTAEPAQKLAAERLKMTPLLELGAGRGGGSGALAALGLLRCAQALAAADEVLLPPLPDPVEAPIGAPVEAPVDEPRAEATAENSQEPDAAQPVQVAPGAITAEPTADPPTGQETNDRPDV
ncbi:MAG: nicotinate-nucleotide--dimethylbenzimidazole phosphoribosyltransferase, partial [Janthinobacterium lividum]